MKKKTFVIIGTRPEAIKMAPVIEQLSKSEIFDLKICVTAQHREMLDQVLNIFNITPDFDLNLMSKDQTLSQLSEQILRGLDDLFQKEKPDLVLVHGDTTTSFAAALSAFYHKIPIAHVEAGLRTRDLYSPYPEELNRQLTGRIANFHFAPTQKAKENLLSEQVPKERIVVTGNTVIDAVKIISARFENDVELDGRMREKFSYLDMFKKMILITSHRRENFGSVMENIYDGFLEIAKNNPDTLLLFPVHPNPQIYNLAHSKLGNRKNIKLIKPVEYTDFIYLMQECYLILTDSGGIQEEGPYFKKPVLVLRDVSERMEAVESGTAILVGTEKSEIVANTNRLLNDVDYYNTFKYKVNPFGSGDASRQIVNSLESFFSN